MVSPLALSVLSKVQDLIDRFGAYAGFAAVLGLALLTLLYIAQARELKRLREWAGQMPERVGDLQGRITPATPSRVTPVPTPAPRPDQPATPAAQAAAVAAAPTVIAAATPAASATVADPPATEQPAPAAAESPLVPGKTGVDGSKVADVDATMVEKPTRPINPLERAQRPQTARAAGAPSAADERGRGPLIAAGVATAAVVAAVGYFLFMSGDDPTTEKRSSKPQAITEQTTTKTSASTQSSNAKTSVFVLNGTTVNGLARGLANSLEQDGFTIKGTDTAADQTQSATLVLYAPGKRDQAVRVAAAIKKGPDVVQAIDPANAALSQNAAVVILVGADQNVTNPG